MDSKEIAHKIDFAKDDVGVITQDAFQTQLGSLSAADWQQAAKMYTKDAANSHGFYIEDSPNGQVTIHNDMSQAQSTANSSVLADTIHDAKTIGGMTVAGVAGMLGMLGLGGVGMSAAIEQAGLAAAVAGGVECAAAFAVPTAIIGAGLGAGIMAGDVLLNYDRHSEAATDLQKYSTVGSPPAAGAAK